MYGDILSQVTWHLCWCYYVMSYPRTQKINLQLSLIINRSILHVVISELSLIWDSRGLPVLWRQRGDLSGTAYLSLWSGTCNYLHSLSAVRLLSVTSHQTRKFQYVCRLCVCNDTPRNCIFQRLLSWRHQWNIKIHSGQVYLSTIGCLKREFLCLLFSNYNNWNIAIVRYSY